MEKESSDKIRDYLGISVPEAYARFIASRKDEKYSYWSYNSSPAHDLFGGVDSVIVHNLELRAVEGMFFKGKWPESWLAIGGDGCGNYYFLDTEEGANPRVHLWSHDPPDQFEDVALSFATFLAKKSEVYFDNGEQADDAGDLEVARTSAAWKSIMNPIGLDEWLSYAQDDPSITLVGDREARNPFTGERIIIKCRPGTAIWKPAADEHVSLTYAHGRVMMEGTEPPNVEKMKGIASFLKARLFGPGGEEMHVD